MKGEVPGCVVGNFARQMDWVVGNAAQEYLVQQNMSKYGPQARVPSQELAKCLKNPTRANTESGTSGLVHDWHILPY